ncbi:MAG: PAS domain S-box protein [Candidatus Omnitrophica bacterium]|nr:PAS domain S-box protein [Candidatus Omnitrophota bacterium]
MAHDISQKSTVASSNLLFFSENLTTLALCFISGLFFYAGIGQFLVAVRRKFHPTHLTFSLACFLFGLSEIATIGTYKAIHASDFTFWLKTEAELSFLWTILFTWFITFYTGISNRWLPLGVSVIYGIFLFLDLVSPTGIWFAKIHPIDPYLLPWGESLFSIDWEVHPWTRYLDIVSLCFPFYLIYALYHRFWVEGHRINSLFVFAILIAAATYFHDSIYRSFGPLDLTSFGFVPLILVMGFDLSRELGTADERYRSFIQNSSEGIYRIDFKKPVPTHLPIEDQVESIMNEAYFFDCNNLYASFYGFGSRDEIIGQPAACVRKNPEEVREAFTAWVLSGYKSNQNEGWIQTARNGHRWLLDSNTGIVEKGRVTRIWGVQLDVTERKRVEEEIRRKDEYFRTLIENSPDVIAVIEKDGTVVYCSPSAKKVLGVEPDSYLGKMFSERIHPEDQRVVREGFARVMGELGRMESVEVRNQHADGSWRVIEGVGKSILGPQQEIQLVINFHDVTQRRDLEEQLAQSQKMEAIGQLAGGVAHDFNNILQAILGNVELMLDDVKFESPMHSDLTEIKIAAERATSLTQQLLAFGRRQLIRPTRVDLNEVVSSLMRMMQRLIGENISIEIVPGHNLGMIHADRGQIEQVLTNLCVNARDAMPAGGTISLRTENVRMDEKTASASDGTPIGDCVCLTVRDNGIGMESEVLAQIFEPFFTTKEVGSGTGLGLAVVYGIVRQHGGSIVARSEPGKGSEFTLYFPRFEGVARPVEVAPQVELSRGSETILVAEDDRAVREIARRILSNHGYRVLVAADGCEALELFRSHREEIDLLMLDMVMPTLGGREVYEEIRNQEQSQVPFLFATGYSADGVHTNFVVEDRLQVLQKPYTPETLLAKVREALSA